MELPIAIRLIEKGVIDNQSQQIWVDLGAGSGLFTKALAGILSAGSTIVAVDKDVTLLKNLGVAADIAVRILQKDFVTGDLDLDQLDGAIMANSLHFVKNKLPFLNRLKKILKSPARLIVVEYDMDSSNRWVPFPLSFHTLQKLGPDAGFTSIVKLGEERSVFNRANIYSAVLGC